MNQEKIIIIILEIFKKYKTRIDETTSNAEEKLRNEIALFCENECPDFDLDEKCKECKIKELSE